MIGLNRKKVMVLIIVSLLIVLVFIGCYKFNKKDDIVEKDTDTKYNEFNGEQLYYDNAKEFEVIEKFLNNNQQVFMVRHKNTYFKSNWKKHLVGDYYLYYDYAFLDVPYELDATVDDFIASLVNLKIEQISGEYIVSEGKYTDKIYSYRIYLKYDGSGEKYGYKLCIDETCKIEDEYDEMEKYGQKKYSESKKINNHWASYYSNIPAL